MSICDLLDVFSYIYTLYSPETTLVKFLLGFYFSFLDYCCNIDFLSSLSSSLLSTSEFVCKRSRFESHEKFFKLLLNICLYNTHVCLFVYSGLWLSGLGSLFLLVRTEGCRFESCHWLLFLYLYSVYTNKKLSHPSSLSYVCAVAPPW